MKETLITIGVIIYIVVSIRKAMSHGKNKTGDKKPVSGEAGWQEKLQKIGRQIKEELEKAAREAEGGSTVPKVPDDDQELEHAYWDYVEDEHEPVVENSVKKEEAKQQKQEQKIDIGAFEKPYIPDIGLTTVASQEKYIKKTPEKVFTPVPSVQKKTNKPEFDKHTLRKAVIWSEILSEPVSLRDRTFF